MPPLRTLALLLAVLPYAGTTGYLQLPGIEGGSDEGSHRGWIEFESVNWGKAPTAAANGTASTNDERQRSGEGEFTLTMRDNKASSAIEKAVSRSTRFATATLDIGRQHYTFTSVMIKTVHWSSSDEGPTETVTFIYGKLEVAVTPEGGRSDKSTTGVGATAMAVGPGAAPRATTAAIRPLPAPAVAWNAELSPSLSPAAREWVAEEAHSLDQRSLTTDALLAAARHDAATRFSSAQLAPGDIDALVFIVLMQAANDNQQDLKQKVADMQSETAAKNATRQAATQSAESAGGATPSNSMSDMSQEQQLLLQQAMAKQSQFEQMISDVMKSINASSSSILGNLK